jgi:uncharacterized protein (TIGR03435 family)
MRVCVLGGVLLSTHGVAAAGEFAFEAAVVKPDWLDRDAFDIEAKAESPSTDRDCSANPSDCGMRSGIRFAGRSQTMATLASSLTLWLRQPVIDKTGLTALYDFDTGPWRPEDPGANFAAEARTDAENTPTIFTALQERLGLRLESQKADTDILVVDSARKPR